MAYHIELENFKGPLDLLLHLIKQHEMDIYDIPIAEITAQYLAALDAMKSLNLEIAGEFLVMASTLLHIKSRLLLPSQEAADSEEEEVDPREELVHRLLEYQKYKEAAQSLERLPLLGRDVFVRQVTDETMADIGDGELQPVPLFELVEALRRLLQEPPLPPVHEVARERLSVAERARQILELLSRRPQLPFLDAVGMGRDRELLIVTFLAVLELVKLGLVRILQGQHQSAIWLHAVEQLPAAAAIPVDEAFGYC